MKTVLVTGASGYIGRNLIEKIKDQDFKCIAITRNPERMRGHWNDKVKVVQCDITKDSIEECVKENVEYIVHCAAPTQSNYMITYPVEVIETILFGTRNVLEFAKNNQVKKIIFLSSMEVYGQIECNLNERIDEKQLGFLDATYCRNCYPIAKLMAENMCTAYYKEYNLPTVVTRLAQTFGRGITKDDNRVFVQFAKAVINHENIVLHTTGESMGNYCDIDDVIDAITFLFDHGKAGEIYNIVNEDNTMTIKEMAYLVANKIANNEINVVIENYDNNKYGYALSTGLRLSGSKMKSIGWRANISIEQMYVNLINDLRKQQNETN